MENRPTNKNLPPEELGLFCDQIAMVLKAGIPLYDAMDTLCESYAGTLYGTRFQSVRDAVAQRGTLYDALRDSPLFPDYLIGMVRIGEATGRLEDVMAGLASFYNREARVRDGIRSAIAYPAVLILMMAVVIGVLLFSVMPVFEQVYASLGADLAGSASAQAGVALGRVVLIAAGALVVALLLVLFLLRTRARGRVMAGLERLLPPVRRVQKALFASRFASVFAIMLASGNDLEQAMHLAPDLAGDADSRRKLELCADAMRDGARFADAVERAGIFEPLHQRMIAAGMHSGSLDVVMARLAELYGQRADTAIRGLVSIIEPTLVALLCVAMGGILFSVMLPLLSLLSNML